MTEDTSVWGIADVSSGKGKSDENFPVGSVLISKQLRPHVHAYYAYARVIDDIADSTTLAPADKIARLDAMEEVLHGQRDPIDRADALSASRLRASLLQTGVPFDTATDLLIAFRDDSRGRTYETWEDLLHYCRYSANPVGRYLICLHGESPSAFGPSDALCTSLQILNHLQDCAGDLAELHRCYVPAGLMRLAGATQDDLRAGRLSPAMRRVFNTMLDGVDALNRHAAALPAHIHDRRFRMECAAIVTLAERLTLRLRREDPLAGRVALRRTDAMHAAFAALRTWR
ncbi:MAG: squalene synthase HpnC [Acetobacter sp.]